MKISPISHSFEMELAAAPWRYPSRASLVADMLFCSGMRYAWFKGNLVPFADASAQDAPAFANPDDVLAGSPGEAAAVNGVAASIFGVLAGTDHDGAFCPLDFRFDASSPGFRIPQKSAAGYQAMAIGLSAALHLAGAKFSKTAEVARISANFRSLIAMAIIDGSEADVISRIDRLVRHGLFDRIPSYDIVRDLRADDVVLAEED